jgi:hypothetical protein
MARRHSADPTNPNTNRSSRGTRTVAGVAAVAISLFPLADSCKSDGGGGGGGGSDSSQGGGEAAAPDCASGATFRQPDGYRRTANEQGLHPYGQALVGAADRVILRGGSAGNAFSADKFNLVKVCAGTSATSIISAMVSAAAKADPGRARAADAAACGVYFLNRSKMPDDADIRAGFVHRYRVLAEGGDPSVTANSSCTTAVDAALNGHGRVDPAQLIFPMPKSPHPSIRLSAPEMPAGGVPFPMDGGAAHEQPPSLLPDNARVHPANIGGLAIAA